LTTETETVVEPKKKKKTTTPIPKKVTPKLVIRMVFALASPEPAIVFKTQIWDYMKCFWSVLSRLVTTYTPDLRDDLVGLGDKAKNLRQARRRRMAPVDPSKG
jgi:hypothetical protein